MGSKNIGGDAYKSTDEKNIYINIMITNLWVIYKSLISVKSNSKERVKHELLRYQLHSSWFN